MSEDATSTPEEDPNSIATGGGGRGCLPVLLGTFLLLGGVFIGTRFGRHLPFDGVTTPATRPADAVTAGEPAPEPAARVHYLIACDGVAEGETGVDLIGVKAQLRPPSLPASGPLTIAVAVSAPTGGAGLTIRGATSGGAVFLDRAIQLDPDDPARPATSVYPVSLELTAPEPLLLEVVADGVVIAQRLLPVRPRDVDGPTTVPTTSGPAAPTTSPATAR